MSEKMTMNKAIAKIMREQGITQLMMAQSIGKEKPNEVSSRLAYSNMSISKSLEMLEVLGYEITIQPKRPGARPKGQIVITAKKKNQEGKEQTGQPVRQ